ncbi:ATP-binding protein [Streptomyces sp. URMC 123]|uniref:ATP-binding protein n=1 Tax=Streptomyces sp. URMC 123 TaxID=3423403 RepID=UPI003F1D5F67
MGTHGSTMLAPLRQGLPPVDPAAVSSSASCPLLSRYESVKGAREFTRSSLERWDLADHFDSVALVVSELVTNALRHALPREGASDPHAQPPGHAPAVRLHLMRWTSRLVCAVRDPSDESPLPGPDELRPAAVPGPEAGSRTQTHTQAQTACDALIAEAESGRGLHLVEAFSDSWGWHPLAGRLRGKVVWALFRLPPAMP